MLVVKDQTLLHLCEMSRIGIPTEEKSRLVIVRVGEECEFIWNFLLKLQKCLSDWIMLIVVHPCDYISQTTDL
jgi:hypothetical protein